MCIPNALQNYLETFGQRRTANQWPYSRGRPASARYDCNADSRWAVHRGSQFLLPSAHTPDALAYDDAARYCSSEGAHLVYLQSLEDYAHMAQVLGDGNLATTGAWIGARRSATGDPDTQFRWEAPVRSSQWMLTDADRQGTASLWTHQTTKKNQHCLQMGGDPPVNIPSAAAAIRGNLCDKKQHFICQRPGQLDTMLVYQMYNTHPAYWTALPHRCHHQAL